MLPVHIYARKNRAAELRKLFLPSWGLLAQDPALAVHTRGSCWRGLWVALWFHLLAGVVCYRLKNEEFQRGREKSLSQIRKMSIVCMGSNIIRCCVRDIGYISFSLLFNCLAAGGRWLRIFFRDLSWNQSYVQGCTLKPSVLHCFGKCCWYLGTCSGKWDGPEIGVISTQYFAPKGLFFNL